MCTILADRDIVSRCLGAMLFLLAKLNTRIVTIISFTQGTVTQGRVSYSSEICCH